jgi:hypothetical protein
VRHERAATPAARAGYTGGAPAESECMGAGGGGGEGQGEEEEEESAESLHCPRE